MKNLTKVKVVLKLTLISQSLAKLTNVRITSPGLLYPGVFISDKIQSILMKKRRETFVL